MRYAVFAADVENELEIENGRRGECRRDQVEPGNAAIHRSHIAPTGERQEHPLLTIDEHIAEPRIGVAIAAASPDEVVDGVVGLMFASEETESVGASKIATAPVRVTRQQRRIDLLEIKDDGLGSGHRYDHKGGCEHQATESLQAFTLNESERGAGADGLKHPITIRP